MRYTNEYISAHNDINSFFSQVRRLGAEDYTPSVQDVLRARSKTTGISETRFNMGQLSIQ